MWSDEVETSPESVRAGPYFVLGRALAHHKQPAEAALDLLRVPILYPEDRPLAAAALLAAGRALEEDSQADAARRLYRELLAEYPKLRHRPAKRSNGWKNLVGARAVAWKLNDLTNETHLQQYLPLAACTPTAAARNARCGRHGLHIIRDARRGHCRNRSGRFL